MQFVDVAVPGGPPRAYEVVIGVGLPHGVADDLARWQPGRRWAVVTDSHVGPLYGEPLAAALRELGVSADCLVFPAGEEAKTRATVADLQDRLIELGHGRDSWLLAVGGGVVGDVGGFVAATLFRGIAYVQVPTTLLAMVDSSVGGKTGVDTPAGKNLVGAFLQPRRVIADLATLDTLPRAELAAGLAEVVKYGVILDAMFFQELEGGLLDGALARDREALARIVSRCCDLKAGVVAADETEAGYRQILNFGHTVGHALESASGYTLRHGEAVAIGMVAEARLSHRKLGTDAGLADRIAALCDRAGLPTEVPPDYDPAALVEAAFHDKKVRRGVLHCALPATLGTMAGHRGAHVIPIEPADLAAVLGRPCF
jgi:3-dehydroquinate synthase